MEEIAKKFKELISKTLEIEEERVSICIIFGEHHVLARVELEEAKFIDAFKDRLLIYSLSEEVETNM